MRNIYILTIAVLMAISNIATAQDEETSVGLVSKRGFEILPETGDIGLGFSANPVLNYLGNFFSGTAVNNAPGVQYPNTPTSYVLGSGSSGLSPAIFVKYMKDEMTAYRARLQLNFITTKQNYAVAANTLTFDPLNPMFVEDVVSTNTRAVLLGLGLEKRRGSSRVQGIYGAELLLGYNKTVTESDYGNQMNIDFNTPDSYGGAYAGDARVLKDDAGSLMFAGARGFAGIEYYFAPKISIGGELGYTIGFSRRSLGETTYQIWDGGTGTAFEYTEKQDSPNIAGYGLGLDNLNAGINLFFYF